MINRHHLGFSLVALPLLAVAAFGQTQPAPQAALPPALRAIFASQLASQLAAADTVTVSISPGGGVPVYSTATTVESGSWVSIYGQNLASGVATWNGDFPQQLGGTSVTVNGKPAYLWFVSPGQINMQTPNDTATGSVNVVVTNASGSATSTVTLGQFGPSWSLLDSKHVAGIIVRTDNSGAYGGGVYDIIGPTGSSLGYATKAAKAGDTVELFAVGFGPTDPTVPPGQAFSGAAQIPASSNLRVTVGGTAITPDFAGMTGAGLYQINLKIPAGLGSGDLPLSAIVGGVSTPTNVVISVQ